MVKFFMSNFERFYILEVGGKQIKCKPGENILIDRISSAKTGDKIKVKRVFDSSKPVNDVLECQVANHLVLGEKMRIYKTKRRKGYEKTIGFRAQFTEIIVGE